MAVFITVIRWGPRLQNCSISQNVDLKRMFTLAFSSISSFLFTWRSFRCSTLPKGTQEVDIKAEHLVNPPQ